jgi:diacylglycerol kinase (ATP)
MAAMYIRMSLDPVWSEFTMAMQRARPVASLASIQWKGIMESPYKGKTGIRRLLNALRYSCDGLREAYRNEDAFRQEVLLALALVPLAFWLKHGATDRALMIGSVLLLIIVELLNSAIEATVDRISLDNHRLAKRAKDIGSAAVLVSLINLAAVWLLVLLG